MNKILFLSYDGLTDALGQSQIIPYMAGLAKQGYNVHILSCEKTQTFQQLNGQIQALCKASDISWHHVEYRNKYPVVSPYSNTKRLKRKLISIHRQFDFDIIHCRSIIPALCAYPLQSNSTKLIFDIRGFWADERVEGRIWNMNIPVYKYLYRHFKRKEKLLFEKSDAIVTLTNKAKSYIKENYKTKNLFGVVPCTVDLKHFDHKKVNVSVRNELGFEENDIVFCYSGSLGTRYLTKEVLQCFAQISALKENSKLLVLTKSDTTELKSLIKQLDIESKTAITSCNYQDIPSYIAACDAAIYFIYEGFSGKAVSPTKQAEFLSLGKPIITNDGIGDTFEIIAKEKVGFVLGELNELAFKKVATEIDELLNIESNHCVEVAYKYFDLNLGIETYDKLYQNLLKQ